ncbi:flavin reductase family protein [Streptomyces iconiensis]|uniref:Flavin reductase family protein n=1 Tax=Streptomyces iconiensis TaxID=1384038 RepID=A0ABT7A4N7_9ACTN|nr:flavin reductase family protein [Streptomyces iconiensis]MDJ1135583.1 flavin reductase family protein [Streptomyces iconiensis]
MSAAARSLTRTPERQPVEPLSLRRVCGLFTSGVTVVSTGLSGRAEGTTVNSFTSVSLDPPLVLFCLHKKSRLRGLLDESGGFTVNLLSGRQQSLARYFTAGQLISVSGTWMMVVAQDWLVLSTTDDRLVRRAHQRPCGARGRRRTVQRGRMRRHGRRARPR